MRYFGGCASNACQARFHAWEPGKSTLKNEHGAYEIYFPLSRLCRRRAAPAAQCRARHDLDLPAHAVAVGWLQLPSSSDLFGLWRRGDRAFRIMGRGLDDAGAAVALPALGHFGNRQRAADKAAGRAMVSAVAVRAMARRQRAVEFDSDGLRQIRSLPEPRETPGLRANVLRRAQPSGTRWRHLRLFRRWRGVNAP
jgi:hypothetical protein